MSFIGTGVASIKTYQILYCQKSHHFFNISHIKRDDYKTNDLFIYSI